MLMDLYTWICTLPTNTQGVYLGNERLNPIPMRLCSSLLKNIAFFVVYFNLTNNIILCFNNNVK